MRETDQGRLTGGPVCFEQTFHVRLRFAIAADFRLIESVMLQSIDLRERGSRAQYPRDRVVRPLKSLEVIVSMSRKPIVLLLALLVVALLAGCSAAAPAPAPVPPTKTPKPTFTPTTEPTTIPFATPQPIQATSEALATVAAQPTAAPTATSEPTAEPTPEVTKLTASQNVNVRSGPGTSYPAIGRLSAGDSFDVTGRNDAGDWVKFDYNGKDGWVTFALVSVEGDLGAVEVAQAPALPTARPQPTARPRPVQQPAAPQPTNPPPAPAAPSYPFQYVEGSAKCEPNAGTTYFNGFARISSHIVIVNFIDEWRRPGRYGQKTCSR
jgi:uncharacterized protein YraI